MVSARGIWTKTLCISIARLQSPREKKEEVATHVRLTQLRCLNLDRLLTLCMTLEH